MPLKLRC